MRMVQAVDNNEAEKEIGQERQTNRVSGVRFWSARTKGERCLTLAFTTVLFVAVVLALGLAFVVTKGNLYVATEGDDYSRGPSALPLLATRTAKTVTLDKAQNDVCLTKGCVKAAAAVIDRIDDTVDPCDDFFQFSCGSFIKKTIIPDEKASVTMFSQVQDELNEKLRLLVEESIKETDSPATQMVKKLYTSCMDKETIQKMGLDPLKSIISEMGGWPIVDGASWKETDFSWLQTIYNNRRIGYSVDYLFDFSVTTDVRNSSWRMIWLDQPSLGMSREYLMKGLNDSDVKAYLQYSIDVATLLGADPAQAAAEMEDVLDFQIDIANISMPREERRNMTKLYNTMTIAEFSKLVPEIPWTEYFNILLPEPLKVDETERIGVSDPNFFVNLVKILERTPKRTVANYLMWRVVAASASFLSEDIRDLQQEYTKKLTGKTTRPPRWKECMAIVSGKLAYAMGNLYVKGSFKEEAKTQADTLVTYIRQEFDEILKIIDWMDAETRKSALQKAATIKSYIGYPSELLMDEKLTEHYTGLVIDNKVLLDNMRRIGIFGSDYSFGKLREIVDKLDWKRHAAVAVVNAYYSSIENSIKFPAGILQGVFFEPDRPSYMNFGGIGFVIGHEITHGFDDQGKQFDSDGNLKNWWEKSTETKFLDKAKCIIWQYGNFSAPENGMQLNGINTQGENIADNGGIKEAYKAYQKWIKDNGAEKPLPGMDYTPNQLFWVSAAQVWCSKYRPESLKVRILTGVHSPGRFRVVGSLSNADEFAADWNCPVGSKMNPAKKCHVW